MQAFTSVPRQFPCPHAQTTGKFVKNPGLVETKIPSASVWMLPPSASVLPEAQTLPSWRITFTTHAWLGRCPPPKTG